MPTYAYACRDCGHALEAVQSFTDDPLTVCPDCGGSLRKKFHAVGISFKGSGFYKTDSRGSAKSAGDSVSSSSEATTSGTSEKKGAAETKSPDKSTSEKKSSDGASSSKATTSTPA